MADSPAIRMQRHRAHKQGNHTFCRRDCGGGRPSFKFDEVPADPGQIFDREGELRRLAVALRTAYLAEPSNAALAKELRMTLLCLPGSKDNAADDELAALMRELSRPVPADESPRWPSWRDDHGTGTEG